MLACNIGFIAGILEGEGCFHLAGKVSPAIQYVTTDLDMIQKVVSLMGIKTNIRTVNKDNPKWKTAYQVQVNGNLAIQWMMTIYSLMSDRRKSKIRSIIQHWKNMPGTNSYYWAEKRLAKIEDIDEFLEGI